MESVKCFPSYGALDAFLASAKAQIVKCWPGQSGEWWVEFRA